MDEIWRTLPLELWWMVKRKLVKSCFVEQRKRLLNNLFSHWLKKGYKNEIAYRNENGIWIESLMYTIRDRLCYFISFSYSRYAYTFICTSYYEEPLVSTLSTVRRRIEMIDLINKGDF